MKHRRQVEVFEQFDQGVGPKSLRRPDVASTAVSASNIPKGPEPQVKVTEVELDVSFAFDIIIVR